jgi:serine/threonine protein kinase
MMNYIGRQLGNYRLVKEIGQGGFAKVYLGEHIHLGTYAAIKLIHTQLDADSIAGFREEARTMIARLVHPNIIRVLDFGVEGNIPFIIMDYAVNGTLRGHYKKGSQLDLETVVNYIKQVAEALQYAHDQRLVHRDVKPENMLFGSGNQVLLSDFGIAVASHSSHSQNAQDTAGTIAYMAPEHIQGHARSASDQYSLGIVAYEWLCGRRPFEGSLPEVVAGHSAALPPPLRGFVQVSPAVEQVVLKALEKDPARRFATVRAFAAALEQACYDGQISQDASTYRRSLPESQPMSPLPISTTMQRNTTLRPGSQTTVPPSYPPTSTPLSPYPTINAQPLQSLTGPTPHSLTWQPLPPVTDQPSQSISKQPPPPTTGPSPQVIYVLPPGYDRQPPQPVTYVPPSSLPLVRGKFQKRDILLIVGYSPLLGLVTFPLFGNYLAAFLNPQATTVSAAVPPLYTTLWFVALLPLVTFLAGALFGSLRGLLTILLSLAEIFAVILIFYLRFHASNPSSLLSFLLLLGLPLSAFVTGLVYEQGRVQGCREAGRHMMLSAFIMVGSMLGIDYLLRPNEAVYHSAYVLLLILAALIYSAIAVIPVAIVATMIQKIAEAVQTSRSRTTR